jgi:hypothetical protein
LCHVETPSSWSLYLTLNTIEGWQWNKDAHGTILGQLHLQIYLPLDT